MQVDIHYYATCALARAGGRTKEDSRIIATVRGHPPEEPIRESSACGYRG